MITRTTRACLVAASLCVISGMTVSAELPRHGASMDDVRKQFGAPASDLGAIGKPAITRWVYENFTVYFEGHRVIQSVATQSLSGAAVVAPPVPVVATPPPAAPAPRPVATPPAFTPAPAPAPAVVAAPVAETPVAVAPQQPAPASTPPQETTQPAAVTAAPAAPIAAPAAPAPAGNGFRFDPATGRLVIDSEPAPAEEEAAPAVAAPAPMEAADEPAESAPEPPAATPEPQEAGEAAEDAPVGQPRTDAPAAPAVEETLEFDPETGTFRPKNR
jgi:hypothetical protein